jgi:hypothetical protein
MVILPFSPGEQIASLEDAMTPTLFTKAGRKMAMVTLEGQPLANAMSSPIYRGEEEDDHLRR